VSLNFRSFGVGLAVLALTALSTQAAPVVKGPEHGTLIIAGGGKLGPEVLGRFIKLAGGPSAEIVVIPTAGGDKTYGPDCACLKIFRELGATNLTVLHTLDRKEADSDAFVAPLKRAKAVWFVGGRQWHLVDSYSGTRTETEIKALLARGGVAKHPDVLGIGIDQSTAIEVKTDSFSVLGAGHVFIHDGKEQPNGGHYYLIKAGDRFDLKTLTASAVR
jgi:cyanophycinase-like exopeptidase